MRSSEYSSESGRVKSDTPLSRGARLCEVIIRRSRARKKGRHQCGRPYLAARLDCTTRQVSRYVAELRAAGRLEVTPPRKQRSSRGWRSIGTNTYRLTCRAHPAPHVLGHNRRSVRGDMGVTPSPYGDWRGAANKRRPPSSAGRRSLDPPDLVAQDQDRRPMPADFRDQIRKARLNC